MSRYSVSERDIKEIENIQKTQEILYSDMDRFTTQVILTYMHNSPMSIDEVYDLQKKITPNISKNKVVALLKDLVEMGFAERKSENMFEHTTKSLDLLAKEGITEDYLFTKS